MTEVLIKRYMVEVTSYPDGREYVRSWLVGKQTKQPKVKIKAQPTQLQMGQEQVI